MRKVSGVTRQGEKTVHAGILFYPFKRRGKLRLFTFNKEGIWLLLRLIASCRGSDFIII